MFNLFRSRTVQAPKNEVELTAELQQATNTLLDSVKGQSPEVIQRAKDLVDRMRYQSAIAESLSAPQLDFSAEDFGGDQDWR